MEWIKCSERMPSKDGKYLTCTITGLPYRPYDYEVLSFYEQQPYFQDEDYRFCNEITHWMELPAPPKDTE